MSRASRRRHRTPLRTRVCLPRRPKLCQLCRPLSAAWRHVTRLVVRLRRLIVLVTPAVATRRTVMPSLLHLLLLHLLLLLLLLHPAAGTALWQLAEVVIIVVVLWGMPWRQVRRLQALRPQGVLPTRMGQVLTRMPLVGTLPLPLLLRRLNRHSKPCHGLLRMAVRRMAVGYRTRYVTPLVCACVDLLLFFVRVQCAYVCVYLSMT